ncbi:hypothetical protein H0H81_012629 [Sphagnurus paluster]|uniref:Enoyl reductase (ER) domain-containing protein n=1 Tax=Sphagnurus paluster TaxID=117069 RepID=A0A9P7GGT9_9AGAR|nr:hypothetical protein H0H81_012629 [Sphagnurus paluster]
MIPTSAREYYFTAVGTHENLEIRAREVERPRANEVLVKVHAVSLQYRDLLISSGNYLTNVIPDLVPCSDMAGEIVEVGLDVKDWKVGDRVCANFSIDHVHGDRTPQNFQTDLGALTHGVLTEFRAFPAHSLVAIPEHLSYTEASTLPCAGITAYNSLMGPTPVKAGDYVLILGTGGVSIFGLQFAVASGAIVIATSSSDEKLKVATDLGAKHVINYKTTPNWDEEVLRITKGKGVDHVIEVGGTGTATKSINSTRIGGYIHLVGFVSQEKSDTNILMLLMMKATNLRPIQCGSVAQFQDMMRLLAANPDKTRPVVNKVFEFEEAKEAYSYLASQAHIGKVVIKVAKD